MVVESKTTIKIYGGNMSQEEIDMGWGGYLKELEEYFVYVDVGVVASDGAQKLPPTAEGKQTDLTLVELATIQEFGTQINVTEKSRKFLHANGFHLSPETKQITIPSRPFIRGTFDENEANLGRMVDEQEKEIQAGRQTRKRALDMIGREHTNQIQDAMQKSGKWEPNHPFTVKQKKSSQPLIKTGHLRQSISHEVG